MDRILRRLKERCKLVDSLLQSLDAPLVAHIRGLGSRIRGPPSAAQLNDTARIATRRTGRTGLVSKTTRRPRVAVTVRHTLGTDKTPFEGWPLRGRRTRVEP